MRQPQIPQDFKQVRLILPTCAVFFFSLQKFIVLVVSKEGYFRGSSKTLRRRQRSPEELVTSPSSHDPLQSLVEGKSLILLW